MISRDIQNKLTLNAMSQHGPRGQRIRGRDRQSMWPIGRALAVCFAAAAAGLAVLSWLALVLLHYPMLPHPVTISVQDTVAILQLIFASVAGTGAMVALVVAYRRQKVTEFTANHDRARVLNERFTAIVVQMGDDRAAVQLAGVYAMAGLADDWPENRQTCVDVLCAYLRMPCERGPGKNSLASRHFAVQSSREVRHAIIRVITRHLRPGAAVSWQGLDLDFTGARFDGGDFREAIFSDGTVSFTGAVFSDTVDFNETVFSGAIVSFTDAVFIESDVHFDGATFSGGDISFTSAKFEGAVAHFDYSEFSGGLVRFGADFSDGKISFDRTRFRGADVRFSGTVFRSSDVSFEGAEFNSGLVAFECARFSDDTISFKEAKFSGSSICFSESWFTHAVADFSETADWNCPPVFDLPELPPPGLIIPATSIRLPNTVHPRVDHMVPLDMRLW